MSVLVLHWRRWWTRFIRRSTEAAVPSASVLEAAAAIAGPAVAPIAAEERSRPDGRSEPDVSSLLETVQRASMESGAETPRTVDPAARERTLAGLRRLQQIPALQSLARGFLHTLNQPDVSIPEVVEAIRKDSALCVRLLRAANSVLVSPERRIEDLDSAGKMMQARFTLRDGHRVAAGFDWRHLWIHALATAAIAEELEKRLRSAGDSQIHLAALLHDVGKIVLSTLAPEDYRDVLMRAWHDGGTLDELERDALGVDHREAGVVFAQHNRLPEVVVQAIAHHDNPAEATSHRLEVALISLANHLSKAHGLGFSGARLPAAAAEFVELPAWFVVEEMCGGRLDAAAVEAGLQAFLAELRVDLRGLRESV
jgi:putative nucleotidyltransferase with HDIG domain